MDTDFGKTWPSVSFPPPFFLTFVGSVRELGVFVPHRMPIAGLYQTGGSTAPGGSVTGQPGRNAAIAMLQDDGKSLEQVLGKPPRP
jgi:phytoene dehydrogenase-like protein